jgi:hypothetical protein
MPPDPNVVARIVNTLRDYREGEGVSIDNARVARWIGQFPASTQAGVLSETAHLLERFYIPKTAVDNFIQNMVLVDASLTGGDPAVFWRDACVLDIQSNSQSQKRMNARLFEAIRDRFAIAKGPNSRTPTNRYIYMDDLIYSGSQTIAEISAWVERENIRNARLDAIFMGWHLGGARYFNKELGPILRARGIDFHPWRIQSREVRNWRSPGNSNEQAVGVLWPRDVSADPHVAAWLAGSPEDARYAEWRQGATVANPNFSSEAARDALEHALLSKGAKIWRWCREPGRTMKPLGYQRLKGVGFGTFAMTFQNCPNNAPLALWWGTGNGTSTLGKWFPLLPRRTRSNEDRD